MESAGRQAAALKRKRLPNNLMMVATIAREATEASEAKEATEWNKATVECLGATPV